MALPLSGTNIRLLTDIPMRPDYKNTRYFSSIEEQTSWFLNKPVAYSISQANYVRIEGKWTVNVPVHIDGLWAINYLMFNNSSYTNKWFYCFVTKLEYLNEKTTRVHFEIDSYQTWFLYTQFKPTYIERQHTTEYINGLPAVNTIDEGLAYGEMYDTIAVKQVKPSEDVLFLVVVAKQIMDEVDEEDVGKVEPVINGVVQPLTFYVTPFMRDNSIPSVTPSGVSSASMVMKFMYKAESAVNNIVSMYVTDYIGVDVVTNNAVYMPPTKFKKVTITNNAQSIGTYRLISSYDYEPKVVSVGTKYPVYDTAGPSKLWNSPYYKIFLDDFKGNRVEIKPEYIQGENLSLIVKGSMGVSNKVSYQVMNYNQPADAPFAPQVGLEYGLINSSPNDVPIITDMLAAYLQGNRNSIENQQNQAVYQGVSGAIGGALNGIGAGVTRNGLGVASAGKDIADSAAGAIFTIQGIQAKQKDIDNTPPSITNMSGNEYFSNGNGYRGLYVIFKRIKPEYLFTLTDFFRRYGYKSNLSMSPNLKSRQHWNFIKTIDCALYGSVPQDELMTLQGIFDRGITVWHTDDIGNYNLTNGVR